VVLNKMTNVTETDRIQGNKEYFRIVQHLSPACRAARRPECAELPSAQILMRVDDNDAAICMSNRNLNLGYVMSFLILIPTLLALSHETIQEGFMEVILPTIFCCFILANDYLLAISPYLLAAPYVIVGIYLIYRYAYLLPSRHRRLHRRDNQPASSGTEQHEAHENVDKTWQNMNLSLQLNLQITLLEARKSLPEVSPRESEEKMYFQSFPLPESIQNMRVQPSRFRHFKYQEKYRKKVAAHYVNKHLWNSESKVDQESVIASEIRNVEQFLVGDRPDPQADASQRATQTPTPRTSRGPLLRSITSCEEDEEKEGEENMSSSAVKRYSARSGSGENEQEELSTGDEESPKSISPARVRKMNRKLTARDVWKAKEDIYNL
jgi:hypothetical protein